MTAHSEGFPDDLSFNAGSNAKTTTSQYKVAYISAEKTASVVNTTATARTAIGIIQSFQSASSEVVSVRMRGKSKVYCRDSVTAGQFVMGYEGVSTTSGVGCIQAIPAAGVSIGVATASVTAYQTILGFATENGQTGQAIEIYLNPYQIHSTLIRE